MLTAAGVTLCIAASVLVYFEYRNEWFFFWAGVDRLRARLDPGHPRRRARAGGGKATVFGAFLDSTTDRIGEAFMLGAIGVALARDGNETALMFTFAAMAGSFLVSYTRSKAETLGLKGRRRHRLARRARRRHLPRPRVAPWGGLQWAIYVLAATAWITVVPAHLVGAAAAASASTATS